MSRYSGQTMEQSIRYGELLARLIRGPMSRDEVTTWCRENDGGIVLADALWWGSVQRTATGGVHIARRRYDAAATAMLREIFDVDRGHA